MMLGPLVSIVIKKRDIQIERSFKIFVGLAVFRLASVGIFSYFVIKNGGNLFVFLITFATVYSVLLIPEVILIERILEKK
jgi:hypothetical protein